MKVEKADLKLVMSEMDLSEKAADLALRESGGDVHLCLTTLINM